MSENKVDKAVKNFEGGYNCCQSILLTYGEKFGLPNDSAIRLGTGFGGGIARQGEVCGAVTGAIMVIGLKYGMRDEGDDGARDVTYDLVNKFIGKFREHNDSIRCRDLLNCDISTPEGREEAKEKELFKTICPGFVKGAAEILEKLIF